MAAIGKWSDNGERGKQLFRQLLPSWMRADLQVENVAVMKKMSLKEYGEMYWKFFFDKAERTPKLPLPQVQVDVPMFFGNGEEGLKACWLGHSSMLINMDGKIILTDPIFERKVSPVGPSRFNKNLPLPVEKISFVDVVIISHDHYDHLNRFSIEQLKEKTGIFVVPAGVGRRLAKWGVAIDKICELDWWEDFSRIEGLKIVATPALHFSGRMGFDKNRTRWASWVITTQNHNIFFSGDTGYFTGLKKIGVKYGPFDVTFLECGAYNENWPAVHMFPEQTVQAQLDLQGKILQPIHWATFDLSMHSWYEPVLRLSNEAITKGVELSVPRIGEIVDYEKTPQTDPWWRNSADMKTEADEKK